MKCNIDLIKVYFLILILAFLFWDGYVILFGLSDLIKICFMLLCFLYICGLGIIIFVN